MRPRFGRAIGFGIGTVLLVAAACGGASSAAVVTSAAPTESARPSHLDIADRLRIGSWPLGITSGFGSVWVVSAEADTEHRGSIARIDPSAAARSWRRYASATSRCRRSPRRAPSGCRTPTTGPCRGSTRGPTGPSRRSRCARAPEGMAEAAGSIWVACEGSSELGRIDPATGRMVSTTTVGLEPRFVASAFGSVWVSNYLDGTLSRVDPGDGTVVATVETASGPQIMLPLGPDLWVSSIDEEVVQRVDPVANRVADTIEDAGPSPDGLFAFEDALWVAADQGPELRRIDPDTLEVTGPWVVSDQGSISDNQLVAVVGRTFWLPLLDTAEVVSVTAPLPSG